MKLELVALIIRCVLKHDGGEGVRLYMQLAWLNMPHSTKARYFRMMCESGILIRCGRGRYRLSPLMDTDVKEYSRWHSEGARSVNEKFIFGQ